ncbi:Dolichyl-phosphate-mannose-protein mannosyltransferase [Natronincola peptidivorans]|uniref:Dolichyl-phosphate-mannose-protein mannosyltransferase n=1 Tax=Natronincola peptidivorans TaxID=426128 RepID=A0A1H9ZIQ2_9FIRM|nr:glycosyltransferase family 39 protein [Natronincola peptidivorans]SES81463.1 Dolichyl-phosphate-mannose-protein mannosyltransferase [Natronincola peptidivorans]
MLHDLGKRIVRPAVLAFYLIFFILVFVQGNFNRGPYLFQRSTGYLVAYGMAISGIFIALYYVFKKITVLQNPKIFIPFLAFISFAPRYVWVRLINTVPIYDFARFHNYTIALIHGEYDAYLEIRNVFPHLSGYPLLLSYVYRIFGETVAVGQAFNIFCSIMTAIVIYLLGRQVFGEAAGQTAGVIFALYPTQIMYNTLLASEHIFLLLFLLALYLFIRYTSVELKGWSLLKLLVVGIVMAVAHIVRPVSSLLFPPMLAYLLFFQRVDRPAKDFLLEKGKKIALVFLGFILTVGMLNLIYIDTVKVPLGKTAGGFNLYVGTDPERDGMWNPTAWEIIEEYDHDFDRVHSEAQRRAIERIKNDPIGFIGLAERKFAIQWGTDDYGYYWSMLELYPETDFSLWVREHSDSVKVVAQSYYMGIIILALLGALYGLKRREADALGLFAMIVLIFAAAHVLIEVQSRYHHPVVPFFILTAVAAMGYWSGDSDNNGNEALKQ